MNFTGLIIAVTTFLVIGLFHPIVIKSEYHFGTKCWWAFALAGIIFIAASLTVENGILSPVLGHPGNLRAEETRGERMVPHEPEKAGGIREEVG